MSPITTKDGHRTNRFVVLILLPMLAMELVLTACSYADGARGKSNAPRGAR